MIKDIDKRIEAIKAEINRLSAIVGSSGENLPLVRTSALDDTTTIVCEPDCIKLIYSERGTDHLILETNDIRELMVRLRYEIISQVIDKRYEIKSQDGMLEKLQKHRELYEKLGPEFVEAHDKDVALIFKDGSSEEQ